MNNKHIHFVSLMDGFPWGGSEELWYNVADNLVSEATVSFTTCGWETIHPKLESLVKKGCLPNFYWPPAKKTLLKKISSKFIKEKTNRFLSIGDNIPDIVSINLPNQFSVLWFKDLIDVLDKKNIPYVLIIQYCDEHPYLQEGDRSFLKNVYQKARHIFFVSERNMSVMKRVLCADLNNASVIDNPIKTAFEIIQYPAKDTISFASVARLDVRYKGQDILLEILSAPFWKDLNWELNLYGSGPDLEYLKSLVNYYKLTSKVFFHSHVEKVENIWKENHILLLPSIGEGTPLSLLEAMMCGRTAIVSDVGGNAATIKKGTGYVSETFNYSGFSRKMIDAWNERETWQEKGFAANSFVMNNVNLESYKEVIKKINDIIN